MTDSHCTARVHRSWTSALFTTLVACSSPSTPGDGATDTGAASDTRGTADVSGDQVTATDTGPSTDGGGQCNAAFPSTSIFYQSIASARTDSNSSTYITHLNSIGWGSGRQFGIDPSFSVLNAAPDLARRPFTQDPGALPDCDTSPVPVPAGGQIEGYSDYECANSGDDCHLLVYQGCRLFELYQASITGGLATGGTFTGSCLAVWDLRRDYWTAGASPYSRGEYCNGADAADVPIAPLLLTAADIQSGTIRHALRFTINNDRIQRGVYVHPATHIGGPTGGADALPYGARLRLRASFNLASLPNDAARVVARALQTYGMFLDDGGNIYVSATTDVTNAIAPRDLQSLQPSDFEVLDSGPLISWPNHDCVRTPVSD